MRKITILFILISFCSFGQKKYFKEAIEKGRSRNEFYFCNLGDGKVVTESDINDYANKNNIIIKNMTFQQVNRFGDSFTGVNTFKFLPITEIPDYVFSRFIENNATITLENIKKYNRGFGNIYNPKTNNFTYQEVYWSNEVLNNNLQGNGFGLYINNNQNEMLFFKGTFDKGILIGEGNFKQYVYNNNFDFENGSLIGNGIFIGNFKNDFAIFKSNNKYGFIDSKFNFITQVKYNSIENEFENGRAFVTLNNEKIIIDEKGNFVDYTQEQKETFELIRRLKEQEERKLSYYKPQIEAYNRVANELSYKYMKQISPNTGKNNSYKFLYNDYEQNVREVSISWIAKQYALADNYHNLQVTGKIYLEEGRFEQISENGNTTAIRNSNNQLNFWKDMGNLAFDGVKTLLASLPEVEYANNQNNLNYEILEQSNIDKVEVIDSGASESSSISVSIGCNNYKHILDKENDGFSISYFSENRVSDKVFYLNKDLKYFEKEIDTIAIYQNGGIATLSFIAENDKLSILKIKFKKGGYYRLEIYGKEY